MTEQKCMDPHCSKHGTIKLHGRIFTGLVKSSKAHRTATIEWTYRRYLPKYERYLEKITRVKAHNPDCINAKEGSTVVVQECRPISKTKHFIITSVKP